MPSPACHVSLVTEGRAPHTTLVNLMEGPPQLLNWVTGLPQPLPVLGGWSGVSVKTCGPASAPVPPSAASVRGVRR